MILHNWFVIPLFLHVIFFSFLNTCKESDESDKLIGSHCHIRWINWNFNRANKMSSSEIKWDTKLTFKGLNETLWILSNKVSYNWVSMDIDVNKP